MASYKIIKRRTKSSIQEADVDNSSSISVTDPALATQALALEKRKAALTKTYNDQIRQIDLQLEVIRNQQIELDKATNKDKEAPKQEEPSQPKSNEENPFS